MRIISEPGRFFAASAFTLAVNVIAKREIPSDVATDGMLYYLLLEVRKLQLFLCVSVCIGHDKLNNFKNFM